MAKNLNIVEKNHSSCKSLKQCSDRETKNVSSELVWSRDKNISKLFIKTLEHTKFSLTFSFACVISANNNLHRIYVFNAIQAVFDKNHNLPNIFFIHPLKGVRNTEITVYNWYNILIAVKAFVENKTSDEIWRTIQNLVRNYVWYAPTKMEIWNFTKEMTLLNGLGLGLLLNLRIKNISYNPTLFKLLCCFASSWVVRNVVT